MTKRVWHPPLGLMSSVTWIDASHHAAHVVASPPFSVTRGATDYAIFAIRVADGVGQC